MTRRSGALSSTCARARLAFVLAFAITGGAAGCAWDWSVRDDAAADASVVDASDADGDAARATTDSGADATVPDGAPAPVADSSADAGDDASTDAPDAAPIADASCATLAAEADAARVQARSCTLGNAAECAGSVMDSCGCSVFVTDTGSTSSKRFATLSRDLQMSGCTNGCSGCPTGPVEGSCLDNPSGVPACYP